MSKSNKVIINIKRVNKSAKIPTQANPTDAGYDL
jgi:dUTPase